MKHPVCVVPRKLVSEFLDSQDELDFELVAALIMQRLYEDRWDAPVDIGFLLTAKYSDLLAKSESKDQSLFFEALRIGRRQDTHIDFLLVSENTKSPTRFQLKRFGVGERDCTTEDLVAYLNSMEGKYAPTNTTLLVALADLESIDLPRVRDEVKRENFPFLELLLIGVTSSTFMVAGILPLEGWSAYDLAWVVGD